MFARYFAYLERQLCSGGQCIAPRIHRSRTGMGFLAVERNGVALDALGPEYDSQRQTEAFEHRALFNVQLDIRLGVLLFPS